MFVSSWWIFSLPRPSYGGGQPDILRAKVLGSPLTWLYDIGQIYLNALNVSFCIYKLWGRGNAAYLTGPLDGLDMWRSRIFGSQSVVVLVVVLMVVVVTIIIIISIILPRQHFMFLICQLLHFLKSIYTIVLFPLLNSRLLQLVFIFPPQERWTMTCAWVFLNELSWIE